MGQNKDESGAIRGELKAARQRAYISRLFNDRLDGQLSLLTSHGLQPAAHDKANNGSEGKRTQQCRAGAVTYRACRDFENLIAA